MNKCQLAVIYFTCSIVCCEEDRKATTCRRDVAARVRTPPSGVLRGIGRAVRAESSDEAGRDRRETERANTMLNNVESLTVQLRESNTCRRRRRQWELSYTAGSRELCYLPVGVPYLTSVTFDPGVSPEALLLHYHVAASSTHLNDFNLR